MDTSTAESLCENLSRQYAAHEELLRAMQAQQQAIRRFQAAELEKLRDRCDLIAQRIAELEDARRRLVGPTARLGELAAEASEPQRSRLTALSAGLRKLAEQIVAVGRVNRLAVENMLNHFHSVYRLLAGADRTDVYRADGQPGPGGGAFLVDAVA